MPTKAITLHDTDVSLGDGHQETDKTKVARYGTHAFVPWENPPSLAWMQMFQAGIEPYSNGVTIEGAGIRIPFDTADVLEAKMQVVDRVRIETNQQREADLEARKAKETKLDGESERIADILKKKR